MNGWFLLGSSVLAVALTLRAIYLLLEAVVNVCAKVRHFFLCWL